MKGAIHGIWLVKPGAYIHPAIIPKLSTWVPIATETGFQVVLWTNADSLKREDIIALKSSGIIVADPKACKDSPLYKYYQFFFSKGLSGDQGAFAMASDILRMAILDFTAEDKYFIYADPNDIEFYDLKENLQHLDCRMKNNKFGFAFPIILPRADSNIFDVRNDVLIAIKGNNPEFFASHLKAYWENLESSYKAYKKPENNTEANYLVNTISNNTSPVFFRLEQSSDNYINMNRSVSVITQYANFNETSKIVNSASYLKFKRVLENGNTWLPSKENVTLEGHAKIVSLIQQENTTISSRLSKESIFSDTMESARKLMIDNIYVLPVMIIAVLFIIYRKIKK